MGNLVIHHAATDCRLISHSKKDTLARTKFEGDFSTRVQNLAAELKTFRYEDDSCSDYFNVLVNRVETIVDEALGKTAFTTEETQALYIVSDEVKKHNRRPHTMWESLNKTQQQFIQKLSPLTEPPAGIIRDEIDPLYFDCNKDMQENVYNFGGGRLFKVSRIGGAVKQECAEFLLTNHPGQSLCFPHKSVVDDSYREMLREAESEIFLQNGSVHNIGRLGELFPIDSLLKEIKENWKIDNHLLTRGDKNRLLMLYRFYVQSIHESLGIPVVKASAIDSKGRWEIRSSNMPIALSKMDFTQFDDAQLKLMAQDIVKHFQVEREWNLKIFGDKIEDLFSMHEGKMVLTRWPTLPRQITEDIDGRHYKILQELSKYPALHAKVKEVLQKAEKPALPRNVEIPESFHTDFNSCINFTNLHTLVTVNTTPLSSLIRPLFMDVPKKGTKATSFNISRKNALQIAETQINNGKRFKERFYVELSDYLKTLDAPMSKSLSEIAKERLEAILNSNNFTGYYFASNMDKKDGFSSPIEYLMLRLADDISQEIESLAYDDNGLKILCRSPFQGDMCFNDSIVSLLHDKMVEQTKIKLPSKLLTDLHAG